MADDAVTFERLCQVLGVVEDYYDANGLVLPERRYVAAGLPAFDCEQVTVRAVRRYPHEGNVIVEQLVDWPGVEEGVPIEVEIVRCAPAMSESGEAPSCEEINTASCVLYGDGDYVLAAVRGAVASGALAGCGGVVWVGWRNGGESGGLMVGVSEFVLNLSS